MTDEPQITRTLRWTRINDNWDQIECWRFDYPNGSYAYADMLMDTQRELFHRQEAIRAAATQSEAA